MGNIETTTKFSRLKSIYLVSKMIILLLYSNLFVFSVSLQLQRKIGFSLRLDLKKSEFRSKGYLNLFVFGFFFTITK